MVEQKNKLSYGKAKWFKFYGPDFLGDPKMIMFCPVQKYLWLILLCLANQRDEGGLIRYVENDEDLMTMARIEPMTSRDNDDWNRGQGFIEKCLKLGMIKKTKDGIFVKNYKKRQETNLTGYERLKRHRAKKQAENDNTNDNVDDNNGNVINDNGRLDKIREDKIREDKITKKSKTKKGGKSDSDFKKIKTDDFVPKNNNESILLDIARWCKEKYMNPVLALYEKFGFEKLQEAYITTKEMSGVKNPMAYMTTLLKNERT